MKHHEPPKGMNPHVWDRFQHAQSRMMHFYRHGKGRKGLKWAWVMNRWFQKMDAWFEFPPDGNL